MLPARPAVESRRMPYRAAATAVSEPRSTDRCRGTRSRCRRGSPASACSRAPASRRPPRRSSRGPWPAAWGRPRPSPTSPDSRKWSATASGQPAGHRLVAHRVDLELERVAGALAGLGRVAHVGRLVVGDRHPLRAEDPERRRDDVGARRGRRGRAAARCPASIGTTSTRSQRPRTRSPPSVKLNSRST